jgi:thymidylate kinase
LELVVLAIRALLKYRDRDVIKDILSIRTPGLPVTILKEFAYLLQRTDPESVRNTLQTQVAFVSPDVIFELLNTVTNSPRAGRVLYRLRRALRRELSAYQRHGRWWAMRAYFGALLRKRLSFLGAYSSGKTPATGGKVLAVIGADGAGKSTLTGELCKWLSSQLRVRRYYMGSQEPSPITRLTHTGYRMAGKVYRVWSSLMGEEGPLSRALHWLLRLSRHVYYLAVGRDRYRRYVAASREAARGAIALCDRYPLAAVHRVMEQRPMDGPQIAAESGNEMNRITRVLSELEKRLYGQIQPPDCIFVLHVSPEVSMQRKSGEIRERVEAKSRALRQMDRLGLQAVEIDADQPYELVLLQVKTALWLFL